MFNNIIPDSAEIIVSSTTPANANEGNMWYNPSNNQLSIYNAGAWNAVTAGSAAVNRYIYTVGTPSGTYNGALGVFPAIYSVGTPYSALEVYINGVHMTQTQDFTATTGTDITLTVAASTNDEIVIVAWGDVSQTVVNTNYGDSDVQTYLTNNSYATESYVTTAVANTVDAAPAALDTLNELAAALNDDANFAATVTADISTKLEAADFDSTFDARLALKTTADLAEAAVDNKYMTDAEKTKLSNIEPGATTDQTDAEIKTAYENNADTNAFTDAEQTKLAGLITDAVNAAGARTEIEGADLDLGANKVLFSNVYANTGDLPSASSYHGMFAHVHGTGAAYYAHAGSWVELANASAASNYATAAQGLLADSATQPGDNVSTLANDANYIDLADLSVTTGTSSTNGALSYDNATGVFTFSPASGYTDSDADARVTAGIAAASIGDVSDVNLTTPATSGQVLAWNSTNSEFEPVNASTLSAAEVNDLSSAVTWVNVPDANITQSSVTQHQTALSITESQISDLQTYLTDITGQAIGDLSDVTLVTPQSGQILEYNGTAFVNATPYGDTDVAAYLSNNSYATTGHVATEINTNVTSKLGQASGIATLDIAGKVPTSQLPSYVDDVEEYATQAGYPGTGETGKIYVDISNGNIHRWSGSAYVQINDAVTSADQATQLATARTIELTGDVTGTVSFDGTSDVTMTTTVVDDSHSHLAADIDDFTTEARNSISVSGDLLYNAGTGVISHTNPIEQQTGQTTTTGAFEIASVSSISAGDGWEVTVKSVEGTNVEMTRYMVIYDGTDVDFIDYGEVFSNTSVATINFVVNSGNLSIRATAASANQTDYTVKIIAYQ